MSTKPRSLLRMEYEAAAEAYLKSLPPEHFMEAVPQATQREITLESLALVKLVRSDFHVFNELLVQYPRGRPPRIQQVVPDNMVTVSAEPIKVKGSYDLPLQPCGPFWVMEYVSQHSKRKDYEESFEKYERELKVPYYLTFYPDNDEMTLYRHNGRRYVTVTPNEQGRYAIPEVELEVAILGGWVRFWHRGKLLELPGELQRRVDEERRLRQEAERRAEEAEQQAREAERQAKEARERAERAEQEVAQLRAELERRSDRPNGA